jgi:hypothetical protein
MKSNLLLKLCAVASSLLLAAGFVSYRAGALDWMRKPDPAAIATPVAPEHIRVEEDLPVEEAFSEAIVTPVNPGGGQMLYSSKSGAVFVEPETNTNTVPSSQDLPEEAAIFSGSKTLMPAPAASEK